MWFKDLEVGDKFTISYLKGTVFTKVEPSHSSGNYYILRANGQLDYLCFRGEFNSYADYGGRWRWLPHDEVELVGYTEGREILD